MSKGLNKHKERLAELNSFGRALTKRSGSKCEFCEEKGVKLSIFEVPPIEEEPEIDNCAFICDTCLDSIKRFKKVDQSSLRFLSSSIWSEVPIVKAVSLFLLRQLKNDMWASDILDGAYIEEEVEAKSYEIEL